MTILPQLNSFVVLQSPDDKSMLVWGRVLAMHIDLPRQEVVLNVKSGPAEMDTCPCPPWKLLHCHHQPTLEKVMIDDKVYVLGPADDSLAWRRTREAIARAMTDFSKYEGLD